MRQRWLRIGVGAWFAVAAWAASTGRADAMLVEVVGNNQANGELVLVAGDLETPTATAPRASLRPSGLTGVLAGGTDPTQSYGPLFADVTMWQRSAGLIDVASGVTGDGILSGTGAASASESSSGSGGALGPGSGPGSGAGMLGTIEGMIGTPSTGTIDGTTGSTGSGSLEGTIGPSATVTLQGTVTDSSPVPLPPSAGLFAAGAAAWAGWRRWMQRAGTG